MHQDLADRIWAEPAFHGDVLELTDTYFSIIFDPRHNDKRPSQSTYKRLAQSALALANSTKPEHREAAYKIGVAALAMGGSDYDGLKLALRAILIRLGNWPTLTSVRLRESFQNTDERDLFPFVFDIERRFRTAESAVLLPSGAETFLTTFQKAIWDRLVSGESLSFSAPTSAGKSFVLSAYILGQLSTRTHLRVAYIVPSRALIAQVSSHFLRHSRNEERDWRIQTTPTEIDEVLNPKTLYVLTPERLQLMLAAQQQMAIDVAIVDEAQTVGNDARGVTLSAVIELLLSRNRDMQLLFASPYSMNPEIFRSLFDVPGMKDEKSGEAAVAQHLVFADFVRTRIDLRIGSEAAPVLASIELGEKLTTQVDRLTEAVVRFAPNQQSLIYAKQPADAEDYALSIAERGPFGDDSEERKEVIRLVREAVHPDYCLAQVVRAGVGFHYGKLPALLRRAVESAFSSTSVRYLVTTSTLLHGVNLPARNVFVRRPYSGHGKPMTSADFWNLAGRAGRLGQEFEGFVYILDYKEWPSKPIDPNSKAQEIKSSYRDTVVTRSEDLLKFISNSEAADGGGKNVLESAFVKLYRDFQVGSLPMALARFGIANDSLLAARYEKSLQKASERISIPADVIFENPSVSAYTQQRLFEYIDQRIRTLGPSQLLPIHPQSPGAYDRLLRILQIIHRVFKGVDDESHTFVATLAQQWMRGDPFPVMIDGFVKAKRRRQPDYDFRKAVREFLEEVDNTLRFTYVRYIQCYISVLGAVLRASGYESHMAGLAPLHVFLELGASTPTMMNLQSLGISRIAARQLQDRASTTDMTPRQLRIWLSDERVLAGLSRFVREEIIEAL